MKQTSERCLRPFMVVTGKSIRNLPRSDPWYGIQIRAPPLRRAGYLQNPADLHPKPLDLGEIRATPVSPTISEIRILRSADPHLSNCPKLHSRLMMARRSADRDAAGPIALRLRRESTGAMIQTDQRDRRSGLSSPTSVRNRRTGERRTGLLRSAATRLTSRAVMPMCQVW